MNVPRTGRSGDGYQSVTMTIRRRAIAPPL
jgi:hypothetical protein